MVAVGDRGVGLEREGATQHSVADDGRQEAKTLVPARAGEEQHAQSLWSRVRRRKRGQVPWLTERPARTRIQAERVAPVRGEAHRVERPHLTSGVGHLASHGSLVHTQYRRPQERRVERGLQQDLCIADCRQQVAHGSVVPCTAG